MLDYINKNFKGYTFDFVNIGGGASLEVLKDSKDKLLDFKKSFKLKNIILEPGRHLIDGVVDLISPIKRIVERKNVLTGSEEQIVTLETGIYHGLLDIVLHGRKFDFHLLKENDNKKLNHNDFGDIILRGPTADSKDVLGIFDCDSKISKNDKVIIKNVGAYVESLTSNFSGQCSINYNIEDDI